MLLNLGKSCLKLPSDKPTIWGIRDLASFVIYASPAALMSSYSREMLGGPKG